MYSHKIREILWNKAYLRILHVMSIWTWLSWYQIFVFNLDFLKITAYIFNKQCYHRLCFTLLWISSTYSNIILYLLNRWIKFVNYTQTVSFCPLSFMRPYFPWSPLQAYLILSGEPLKTQCQTLFPLYSSFLVSTCSSTNFKYYPWANIFQMCIFRTFFWITEAYIQLSWTSQLSSRGTHV